MRYKNASSGIPVFNFCVKEASVFHFFNNLPTSKFKLCYALLCPNQEDTNIDFHGVFSTCTGRIFTDMKKHPVNISVEGLSMQPGNAASGP